MQLIVGKRDFNDPLQVASHCPAAAVDVVHALVFVIVASQISAYSSTRRLGSVRRLRCTIAIIVSRRGLTESAASATDPRRRPSGTLKLCRNACCHSLTRPCRRL